MIEQAVVLCGGVLCGGVLCGGVPCGGALGEKAEPMAAGLPLPLLPAGGAPFLDTLLFELGRHGFRRIVLLAAGGADHIAEYAAITRLRARFDLDIDIVAACGPEGSGDALRRARDRLDAMFLLLHGAC